MKRRCKVIIAVDAEADPTMSFGSFLNLERCARIDLGATVDLPWKEIRDCTLRLGQAVQEANKDDSKPSVSIPGEPGPHCAVCEIQYGPDKANNGVLLYIKASLSGDEPDYVLDYKRRYPDFPHQTTGDQFFGEEQLEAYRALGFHIMKGALTDEKTIAAKGDKKRILDTLRAAILGSELKLATGL